MIGLALIATPPVLIRKIGVAVVTGGFAALFTVTTTSSYAEAPALSVTVSLKVYVPATSAEAVSVAVVAFVRVAAPPLCFVQLYDAIDPSESLAVPVCDKVGV